MASEDFYCRYYTGHKGKFGHEYMEFEFLPNGLMKYANNSAYKSQKSETIRKQVMVSPAVVDELKRIVADSGVTKEDDEKWPSPDREGEQNLEIKIGNEHISFTCAKIQSMHDVQDSEDPEGLRCFYYLVQDLKCFVFSLISLHFKIKPIP